MVEAFCPFAISDAAVYTFPANISVWLYEEAFYSEVGDGSKDSEFIGSERHVVLTVPQIVVNLRVSTQEQHVAKAGWPLACYKSRDILFGANKIEGMTKGMG